MNSNQVPNVRLGTPEEMTKPMMMSSREIVEVAESIGVEKEHKHVLRDIRVMLLKLYGGDELARMLPEKGAGRFLSANAERLFDGLLASGPTLVQDSPTLGQANGTAFAFDLDVRGSIVEFRLDKRHSLTLVTGYDVVLRDRCIQRLDELERALVARAPSKPEVPAIADKTIATVARGIMVLDLLAGSKSYGLTQDEHRNGIHKLIRTQGLPVDMLPQPTDDTYSDEGSATHLLKSAGRCLPVPRFFKMLEEIGIVYRFTRVSTKNKDVLKSSWRFTTEGMRYGYDERVSRSKDYTCVFYVSMFTQLLRLIAPVYERLIASGEYRPKWSKGENAKHAREYLAKFEKKSADGVGAAYEVCALR